jgi:hypothetical protein
MPSVWVKPQDVAEALEIAVAASAFAIAEVRSAVDRPEMHHVVADVPVPLGIAGMKHEAFGCMGQLRLDQLAPERTICVSSSTRAPARR